MTNKNFWLTIPKPIIALAPMAGYTDSAFRQLCKNFGADVMYSEMISVDAICHNNQKTLAMLNHNKKEYPLIFQLFGNDPDKFTQAVKIINKNILNTKYSILNTGLDINLGCPAHKVTKTGSGASLMDQTDKACQIIKAVCENSQLPVSIKIRTKVKNITALEFIKKIKNLPWTAVMVHGRSLSQGFSGKIDYQMIKKIKQLVPNKIVLANGGIKTPQDAINMLSKTSADGLGIARGAWGNPWLFHQIKTNQYMDTSWPARKKIILKHAELFLKNNNNLIPLRKHFVHYTKGQKNASELRQKLITITTLNELKKILSQKL